MSSRCPHGGRKPRMPSASRVTSVLALTTLSAVSATATAAPPQEPSDLARDRFDNIDQIMIAGFNDISFDSGWIPANSPVQMRIEIAAANTLSLSMFGEAMYDWAAETLQFVGGDQGGSFKYDVGLQLHASVLVDVVGFTWMSDLLGPYDLLIEDDAQFTPYLLAGNPDRPVIVSDKTEGVTVASVPLLPDIIIASGNLDIDVAFDVMATLEGKSIRATGPLNEASVVAEGEAVSVLPDTPTDPGEALEVEAQLLARVTTDTTVIVRPHLVMEILGTPYDIGGIDIPVALPEFDDDFVFEAITLQFDRPQTGAEGGEADGGEAEAGSGDDAAEASDEASGTGESEDGAGVDNGLDDGCACISASSGPRSGLAWFFAAMSLVWWNRRRPQPKRARS